MQVSKACETHVVACNDRRYVALPKNYCIIALLQECTAIIQNIRNNQRRRRHFKSGQATANKRSLVHVHGGRVYNRQCAAVKATCGIKIQLYKKKLKKNKYNPDTCSLRSDLLNYCKQQKNRHPQFLAPPFQ